MGGVHVSWDRGSALEACTMAVMGSAIMTVLVLSGLLHSAAAVTFTVGESVGGWVELRAGQPSFDDQFANVTLVPGDQLLFPYRTGAHNVYEVTPANLASCTGTNALQMYTNTNTTITLTAGVHAYICEIPGHCTSGRMYLTVNVTGGATAPAPAAPVPAPVAGGPVPVPVPAPVPATVPAPGPTPVVVAPSPGASAPSPPSAPGPGPSGSTPGSPGAGEPAAGPEGESPGGSGANILLSGPAMLVGSLLVGCMALLL